MRKSILTTIISSTLIMALCCGCGNSSASYDSMPFEAKASAEMPYVSERAYGNDLEYAEEAADYDYEESAAADSGSVDVDDSAAAAKSERKLIRNVNITTETKEYDALLSNVKRQVDELGGYIESLSEYQDTWRENTTRNASLTIRVPKAKADKLITAVEDGSNITSRDENLEDVTLAYVDMESHKKALETEQDRLLELMEKAESLEDIITIEERLTNVRYQIESMESQLRTYDNKIDYTTIHLNISEVRELTPTVEKGYFEKMGEGFLDSLSGVFVGIAEFISWFIVHIPYFVIWAIIIFAAIKFVIKPWRKRRAAKRAGTMPEKRSFKFPWKKNKTKAEISEKTAEETLEETASSEEVK